MASFAQDFRELLERYVKMPMGEFLMGFKPATPMEQIAWSLVQASMDPDTPAAMKELLDRLCGKSAATSEPVGATPTNITRIVDGNLDTLRESFNSPTKEPPVRRKK